MDALFSGRKRRGTLSTKFKTDLIVREGGISAHGRANWDTCEGATVKQTMNEQH